jgi:hypothetical protein
MCEKADRQELLERMVESMPALVAIKRGEKPVRRKSKVSWARLILPG